MMDPTSVEMVRAAETAAEVACADEAVAWRKLVEAIEARHDVRTARAEWVIAHAASAYARGVVWSVRHDYDVQVPA